MKMFFAQLSDKSYIHVPADRMEVVDNMAYIYDGEKLMAIVDVSMILFCHISNVKIIGGNSTNENCTR
jgi:hypothetical protein